MSDIKVSSTPAISFAGLLTIVLVILKALGYITWSWWWVFSPLWISAIVGITLISAIIIFAWWIVKKEDEDIKKKVEKMCSKYDPECVQQDKRFK